MVLGDESVAGGQHVLLGSVEEEDEVVLERGGGGGQHLQHLQQHRARHRIVARSCNALRFISRLIMVFIRCDGRNQTFLESAILFCGQLA